MKAEKINVEIDLNKLREWYPWLEVRAKQITYSNMICKVNDDIIIPLIQWAQSEYGMEMDDSKGLRLCLRELEEVLLQKMVENAVLKSIFEGKSFLEAARIELTDDEINAAFEKVRESYSLRKKEEIETIFHEKIG